MHMLHQQCCKEQICCSPRHKSCVGICGNLLAACRVAKSAVRCRLHDSWSAFSCRLHDSWSAISYRLHDSWSAISCRWHDSWSAISCRRHDSWSAFNCRLHCSKATETTLSGVWHGLSFEGNACRAVARALLKQMLAGWGVLTFFACLCCGCDCFRFDGT